MGERMKRVRLWGAWQLLALFVICNWTQEGMAMDREETIVRTGIKGKAGRSIDWDISPDGTYILFNTGKTTDGLLLLDVKKQQVSRIPGEPGRFWEMAAWSHDGSQVVAISTAIRDGYYQVGQQEVIVLDPRDWRHRKLAATEGVNIFPFSPQTARRFTTSRARNGTAAQRRRAVSIFTPMTWPPTKRRA